MEAMVPATRYSSFGENYSLLQLAAELSSTSVETVEALAAALLAVPVNGRRQGGGRSTLNNDGSPLQLCVTSTEHGCRFRLLGDPAAMLGDPLQRVAAGYQALAMLLDISGSSSLKPLCERTWQCSLPADPSPVSEFMSGVCWLAGSLDSAGIALYLTARWGPVEQRWQRTLHWLEAILPNANAARSLMPVLTQHAYVASVGIEGVDPQHARAKLYWRLRRPVRLDDLNIQLLTDPTISQFLDVALEEKAIALSGLVFSLGFSLTSGALEDVKIDVCAHCLRLPPEMWVERMNDCVETFQLTPLPTRQALIHRRCEIAFFGLGVDRKGTRRLNLYLKLPS